MKMYKLKSAKQDERIAKAEWLLGYIMHRFLHNPHKAIIHFERAYKNSTKSIRLSKNAFWLAEAHLQANDPLLALNWYKKAEKHFSTFYGYLAKTRIQLLNNEKFSVITDFTEKTNDSLFTPTEMIFYNRELVQVLLSVKDRSMAKYFYQSLIHEIDDPNEEALLLDLAYANGEVEVLITENSMRQHYFSSKLAYQQLTMEDMKCVERIDKSLCFLSLVHAVIHRESRFNENARSHVGAIGLMQVMPATAKYEAKKIKFYLGQTSLFNRRTNITIGAAFLQRLLKKYKNNIIYTIAAYNCGEGGVSKYQKSIKNLKNLTLLDLMELMPIKETRIYLKHVVRALFAYSEMFFAGSCYNCSLLVGKQ
jgi:soluble lytic murein transglycosylase